MAMPAVSRVDTTRTVRDVVIVATLVLAALLTLYAVFLDNGALLYPALGKVAIDTNYLHELAHDGRHTFGAPCH